jgi:hypothetical protein
MIREPTSSVLEHLLTEEKLFIAKLLDTATEDCDLLAVFGRRTHHLLPHAREGGGYFDLLLKTVQSIDMPTRNEKALDLELRLARRILGLFRDQLPPRARERFDSELRNEVKKYESAADAEITIDRLMRARLNFIERYVVISAALAILTDGFPVELPLLAYRGAERCVRSASESSPGGFDDPSSPELLKIESGRRLTAAYLQIASLRLERKLRHNGSTSSGRTIWAVIGGGIVFAALIIGLVGIFSTRNTAPSSLQPPAEGASHPTPEPQRRQAYIPSEEQVRQIIFDGVPDNRRILDLVYGNANGPGESALWSASQLPANLDRGLLLVRENDTVAFRIVYREAHMDSAGRHRLFVVTAGTGSPLLNFSYHACRAAIGLIVLRQDGAIWRVEAMDRAADAVGEYGAPADQYSLVRWGREQYGVLMRVQHMSQGQTDEFASLLAVVEGKPRLIASLKLAYEHCDAFGRESPPCRSGRGELSFVEAEGDGPWDLEIRRRIDEGLKEGESPSSGSGSTAGFTKSWLLPRSRALAASSHQGR